jgi:predicted nucleic acid-binding protein
MLVLDTSVILNLLGSGRAKLVLENIGDQALAPLAVLNEIRREPELPMTKDASLAELLGMGLITAIECTEGEIMLALELAGASAPDDLDDGEAYAIACAVNRKAAIGVDDNKARRVLSDRWPTIAKQFTIELIELACSRGKFDAAKHAEIVYSALRNARMRVPKGYRRQIIDLIGLKRARECPSLGIIL